MNPFQTFPILSSTPPTKDWSAVSVNSDLGTKTIYKALVAQVERFQEELKTIAETGQPTAKHKARSRANKRDGEHVFPST